MTSIDRLANSVQRHRQAISDVGMMLWATYPLVAFAGYYAGLMTGMTSLLLGLLWIQATVGYIALHVSNRWDTDTHGDQ